LQPVAGLFKSQIATLDPVEKYNYVLNQQFWDKYTQIYTIVSATGK
jgi:hypothetical protein